MRRIAVIGGGVSGLACALTLLDRGADPVVFEADAEPGGWVRTETVDGHQCERGPAALRGPAGEGPLLERLGLHEEKVEASPAARDRYLVHRGRLVAAPRGPAGLITTPLLPALGKVRLLAEPFVRAAPPDREETVAEFFRRRFGRSAARLADPVVSGIFAGDADRLSMTDAFPELSALEQEHGSVLRGLVKRARAGRRGKRPRRTLYGFRGGLGRLSWRLREALGDRFRGGRPVETLTPRSGGGWRLHGEDWDQVVLAVPSHRAAVLIEPWDEDLAETLAQIPFAGVVVASLSYPDTAFQAPPTGFGLLAPRSEGLRLLGCIFESSLFPHRAPPRRILLRVLLGGRHDPAAVDTAEDALVRTIQEELELLLDARAPGRLLRLGRHARCIPQYETGHGRLLRSIEKLAARWPGLHLTGNSYRGVSVPQCLADGVATGEKAWPAPPEVAGGRA